MRNKIVGTITDPDDIWGGRIPIDKGIIKFLRGGEKTLGEIRILIAQHDPQPEYTKMGVLKVLERLKKKVRKNKSVGERYPKYSLTNSALHDITIQANLFSIDASKKILNDYRVDQRNIDSFLEGLVKGIGVYTLFNYFHSFKFTSTKYSHKQNIEKRQAWIQQTIPMYGISWIIERSFDRFMPNKDYMRRIFEDEESVKFLSKFEEKLQKSFPEEFDKCKEVLDNLNKNVTIHNKWISDLEELEQWQKECDSKNKRNFKKKLKINECPRCHNDGSFPTPKGECKGKIFDCGFYLDPLPDSPQNRRCPSCGYRGTHEEYRKLILRV